MKTPANDPKETSKLAPPKARKGLVGPTLIVGFVFALIFFSYQEGYSDITRIVGVLLGVLFLYSMLRSRQWPLFPREFLLLVIWLMFTVISGLFASGLDAFFAKFFTMVQIISISYVIFNYSHLAKKPLAPVLGIYLATLTMCVLVLYNPRLYLVQGRMAGTLGNANLFGLALVTSLVFVAHKLFSPGSKMLKITALASAPFLIYMIGLTGSRKGIISALLLIIFCIVRFRTEINRRPLFAIGSAVLVIGFLAATVAYFVRTPQFQRTEQVLEALQEGSLKGAGGSLRGRVRLYEKGFDMFLNNPVLGVGLGNFGATLGGGGQRQGTGYAHSNYIEVLAGSGLLGFILYFSIYVSLFWRLWVCRRFKMNGSDREVYYSACILLVLFIANDFAMVSYYEKLSWLIMAALISATVFLEETYRVPKNLHWDEAQHASFPQQAS